MEKLVSIIIPVYNGEKYIDQCLDSITNQTYKNIEIIVVNDGSKDSTEDKLNKWKSVDSRLILINKENEGVSVARNHGLYKAKGKYIFFFDSDDTIEEECVNKVVTKAEKENYDTILYGYASIRENNVLNHKLSYKCNEYISNEDIIKNVVPYSIGISYKELNEWLQGKREIRDCKELTGPWRICYSTRIIKDNGIKYKKNLKVGEDTIFTNEYLSHCDRIGIIDECLYYLHNHEESSVSKYLNNIEQIINNKLLLFAEKEQLSNLVLERTGINISEYWGGEVLLSAVQIGWLLTDKVDNKSWYETYKMYNNFIRSDIVGVCRKRFECKLNFSMKTIPLLLIKYKMIFIVFILMSILKKIGFKINVG